MNREVVTVVSGLPRSGTSMMMKMLEAGGMEVLTDKIRTPDEDNPKGYYEFERVKKLPEDQAWLQEAKGRVVKIISRLLLHLPPQYAYKVIFMRREMGEILASQNQMLMRRGKPVGTISDEKMAELFQKHLREVEAWMEKQPTMDVIYVSYNEVLENPVQHIEQINQFLGASLDVNKMVAVVDKALHRQRQELLRAQ
jgi:broad-specificity NMP kinase